MKKINNKYRNNNFGNSQIYSLNYKFDSTSPAGKINGTALDLIKRYNELAKDAMSNNDYITAELYRQYAEHYRKIVTEINEKKQQQRPQPNKDILVEGNKLNEAETNVVPVSLSSDAPTEEKSPEMAVSKVVEISAEENKPKKKSFTVIEISDSSVQTTEKAPTKKRVYRRKTQTPEKTAETKNEIEPVSASAQGE